MQLLRQLAIGSANLVLRGLLLHAQHGIGILAHGPLLVPLILICREREAMAESKPRLVSNSEVRNNLKHVVYEFRVWGTSGG